MSSAATQQSKTSVSPACSVTTLLLDPMKRAPSGKAGRKATFVSVVVVSVVVVIVDLDDGSLGDQSGKGCIGEEELRSVSVETGALLLRAMEDTERKRYDHCFQCRSHKYQDLMYFRGHFTHFEVP